MQDWLNSHVRSSSKRELQEQLHDVGSKHSGLMDEVRPEQDTMTHLGFRQMEQEIP